jgi:hypothetical protein
MYAASTASRVNRTLSSLGALLARFDVRLAIFRILRGHSILVMHVNGSVINAGRYAA